MEAALAMDALLIHDLAVEFCRPFLEVLLKTYLNILDEINYIRSLIEGLKNLVEVYNDDIAPYAVFLCSKLGDAYLHLLAS
jgi:hypothetical protein